MTPSHLLLLGLPALAAAVPLILCEPRSWYQTAARLGAFGLGLSAWIDLVDNLGAGGVENDPVLLTGGWALSGLLVVVAAVAATVDLLARRRQRA
jgi:hypothetical protein